MRDARARARAHSSGREDLRTTGGVGEVGAVLERLAQGAALGRGVFEP